MLDTSSDQCNTDQDCTARADQKFKDSVCRRNVCVPKIDTGSGGAAGSGGSTGAGGMTPDADVDPVWGCLGHVTPGTPQPGMVSVSLPFFDLLSMGSVTGVGVRACPKLDVNCMRPVNSMLAIADPQGIATFKVLSGFDGYGQIFEVSDGGQPVGGFDVADAGDGGDAAEAGPPLRLIPSVVFFTPPIIRDTTYGIVPLFKPGDIDALAAVQGNNWNRSSGLLFVGALDCSRKPVAGVTWEPSVVNPVQKRFFYVNGFPDEAAVASDATGFGGLLNAMPGTITITARLQATGVRVGEATVLVKAGVASYIYLPPTP